MFSPLEQFSIVALYSIFTNSMLFGTVSVLLWSVLNGTSVSSIIPSRWLIIVGSIYTLMGSMIHQTLGTSVEMTRRYFVFIYALFVLVLMFNRVGLIPYSFTVTSHLIITLVLSFAVWMGKANVLALAHRLRSFGLVYPSGIGIGMAVPLIFLETLGFVITIVSLSVRLFANMMAGHILLKVLAGFAWTMALGTTVIFLSHVAPLVVIYLMMFMESGIAFIQAYVFALLTCIYLGDAINGGH